jgi:uncharacterized paraquat-inducible protein A
MENTLPMLKKFTYEQIKSYIESFNYKLQSKTYKNNNTKLEIKCPEDHIYKVTYGNFQKGSRCPECNNSKMYSKAEKEIQAYVAEIFPGIIINNDRNTILSPLTGYFLELDVYFPELMKAIEFNGVY